MPTKSAILALTELSAASLGIFRGRDAVDAGVTRKRLASLRALGLIERVLPDTYRLAAIPASDEQALHAALAWAGDEAAAAGRSAAQLYGLEGVSASVPEIAVPKSIRARSASVVVHHGMRAALMVREMRGLRVTGIECTLLQLAANIETEAFEIAFEDARRRRLTSVPALRAYLERFGRPGRNGTAAVRQLLRELDPVHASRSTLEVKTRRLLVAHGITGFVREFALDWGGRTYLYDFVFERERIILETNGRRWHNDPVDYEHDNDKWSVPARRGYRIVFATWDKVTKRSDDFLCELMAALQP